jgi:hypothetical protein
MWTEFRNSLLRNPVYKVTAVLTAIFAWIYVQGGEEMDASVQVRIEWTLPAGLVPVNPPVEITTAKIRGTRSAARRVRGRLPYLKMDASSLGAGMHEIRLEDLQIESFDPGVTLLDLSPATVALELDEWATRKVVVEPIGVGEPGEGVEVRLTARPSVLEIRGPRTIVAPLRSIPTHPMDISAMSKDVSMMVGLDLPRQVTLKGSAGKGEIEVEVTVASSIQVREFLSTPVHVWRAEGWTVEPSQVALTLRGDAQKLAALGEQDLVVFAHLSQDTSGPVDLGLTRSEGGYLRVLHPEAGSLEVVTLAPATVRLSR